VNRVKGQAQGGGGKDLWSLEGPFVSLKKGCRIGGASISREESSGKETGPTRASGKQHQAKEALGLEC